MTPLAASMHAVTDAAIPGLALALDPDGMTELLRRYAGPALDSACLVLERIEVRRHKPGRRCLLAYHVRVGEGRRVVLLGKVRARGADTRTFTLHQRLEAAGFRRGAAAFVPPPVALVPEAGLWLQRWVDGVTAASRFGTPDGPAAAAGVAQALVRLQRSGVRPDREHGAADELRVLQRQLAPLAADRPALAPRLERLLARVTGRARCLDDTRAPVHRDFYQDQVILAGSGTCLIDLDLYSLGHPALDAGNFAAHLIELGLREHGDPHAFDHERRAFEDTWLAAQGQLHRQALADCTTLTLARLVGLAWQLRARRPMSGALLTLTEARLSGAHACDPCG